MELIDKATVVAKIKRLQDATMDENANFYSVKTEAEFCILSDLENFIDTLEMKEVNLDRAIDKWIDDTAITYEDCSISDVISTAKHFYELGLSVQTSTVWHYVLEEIPTKFGNSIIVASLNKNKEDGIWLYDLIQSWDGEWSPRVNWENPVKWAYMDDLIKQIK